MDDKAFINLLKDLLDYKKREARFLFIALIVVICMNLLTVGAFLYYESTMETVESVSKTTTQTVDGKDNDIVNGDQYNDESENKGVVNNDSNTNNYNDSDKNP